MKPINRILQTIFAAFAVATPGIAALAGPPEALRIDESTICTHDGDVNRNGVITAGDAQQAFFVGLGMLTVTFREHCSADCNADSYVSSGDAQRIFFSIFSQAQCENSCGPDAYEADGTASSATLLEPEVPQLHSICPQGDQDWWTFTLSAPSHVVLDTAGPAGDTVMALLDSATNIIASDESGDGDFSHIATDVPAGTYYVRVADFEDNDRIFEYRLTLTVAVPTSEMLCADGLDNDADTLIDCDDSDCSTDPLCLSDWCQPSGVALQCGDVVAGSTIGQVNAISAYTGWPWDMSGPEMVYTFTVPERCNVTATLADFTQDVDILVLAVQCAAVSLIAAGDLDVTFPGETGVTYYLVIDGLQGAASAFALAVQCAPAEICDNNIDDDGDEAVDCADVECYWLPGCVEFCEPSGEVLACGAAVQGSNVGQANLVSAYDCVAWDESGPERVYRFEVAQPIAVTVALADLTADLDVFVLAGSCSSHACSAVGDTDASFMAQPDTTYFIVVEGYQGATGSFTLSVTCATPLFEVCDNGSDDDGDNLVDCYDADCSADPTCNESCVPGGTTLACGDLVAGSNIGLANNISAYTGWPWDLSGPEMVYAFTVAENRTVTASLGNLMQDLDVLVLAGQCAEVGLVAAGDTQATFLADSAVTYYLVVDGFQGAASTFVLGLQCTSAEICNNGSDDDGDDLVDCDDTDCSADPACVPPCADLYEPDEAVGAETLLAPEGEQTHSICPVGDADWWVFTLPAASLVTLETMGATGDTEMYLFDTYDQIGYDNDSGTGLFARIDMTLSAGTYYVAVNEYGNDAVIAQYDILLSLAPPSEICDNGSDDDGDDQVDCADGDCSADPACNAATCNPIPLALACGQTFYGSTVTMTDWIAQYDCSTWDESGPDLAVPFSTPVLRTVTAQLVDASADLDLFVLQEQCAQNTCVGFGDNEVTFTAQPNVPYFLSVDGYAGAQGSFTLTVTCH